MARVVFVCFRDPRQAEGVEEKLRVLSRRVIPDNITPNPPLIIKQDGLAIGVFNPVSVLPVRNTSVCAGAMFGPRDDWWKPGTESPDGSYALFRSDEHTVELVADILASRTIWYVQTEDVLIASTSHRAIVFFLQEFQPNYGALLWMLSCGLLGLGNSYDRRVQCLGPDSRLVLDRRAWQARVQQERVEFKPLEVCDEEHRRLFEKDLDEVFDSVALDPKQWLVMLSGGIDSRCILLWLKDRQKYTAVTWGTKSAVNNKKSDAHVAKLLAESLGVKHEYFLTEMTTRESKKAILDRFLVAGEGRNESIIGYIDGFAIWKWIFEAGYGGVIRGDTPFGGPCPPVFTELDVRRRNTLTVFSDYPNLGAPGDFGLDKLGVQRIPEMLLRKEDETLETWRDRLNQQFRVPAQFTGWTELKLPYVEVANPLCSRKLVVRVRALPDRLRNDRRVYVDTVLSRSPRVPVAKYHSIQGYCDVLESPDIVDLLREELSSQQSRELFSPKFVDYVIYHMKVDDGRSRRVSLYKKMRTMIGYTMPVSLKHILRSSVAKEQMYMNTLAFRAYIVLRTHQMLNEDAKAWVRSRK